MTEAMMPVTAEQCEAVKLLACPFCGGEATLSSETCGWRVDCIERDCYTRGPWPDDCTESEAIAAWNTRATPPAPAGLAGGLEEAGEHWRTFKSSWLHKHGAWPTGGIDAMQALNRLLPNSCGPKEAKRLTALTSNGSQPDRVGDVREQVRTFLDQRLKELSEIAGSDHPDRAMRQFALGAVSAVREDLLSTLDAKDQSND